jgi:hypothetical protein
MARFQPEDVIEAVRSLCPVLDRIPHQNPALAADLQTLLLRSDQGELVHQAMIDRIKQEPRLWRWLHQALVGEGLETFEGSIGIAPPLPGTIEAPGVGPLMFHCPRCPYTWSFRRVGQTIPKCPVDGIPLEMPK